MKEFFKPASLPALKKGQNRFEGGCSDVPAFLFCKAMALGGKRSASLSSEWRCSIDTHHAQKQGTDRKGSFGRKILITLGHTIDSISLKVDKYILCGDAATDARESVPNQRLEKIPTCHIEDPFEKAMTVG